MRLPLDIPCALPIWLSEYVWERVILYVYEPHKQFLRKAFVFILENRIQCMSYTIAKNNVIFHKMEQKIGWADMMFQFGVFFEIRISQWFEEEDIDTMEFLLSFEPTLCACSCQSSHTNLISTTFFSFFSSPCSLIWDTHNIPSGSQFQLNILVIRKLNSLQLGQTI